MDKTLDQLTEWHGRMIVAQAMRKRKEAQVIKKKSDPTKPTATEMNGTPIGAIPYTIEGGEVKPPAYFAQLLDAAGLKYNGGWVIVMDGNRTTRYERFKMLQEAVRVAAAKNLYSQGMRGFIRMDSIDRDDLLCACLGRTNVLRVKVNGERRDANIATMSEVLGFTTQRLSDWLGLESKEPEYRGKQKTIKQEELPDMEAPLTYEEKQKDRTITIHRNGEKYELPF